MFQPLDPNIFAKIEKIYKEQLKRLQEEIESTKEEIKVVENQRVQLDSQLTCLNRQ